jgi:hypothetical protein
MELFLYNVIFNILMHIFWKIEINLMNKKLPKCIFKTIVTIFLECKNIHI